MTEQTTKTEKVRSGTVVAKSGDKTISVLVTRFLKHSRYGKFVRRRKKFLVHDETNSHLVGETVSFVPSRPVSKGKHFKIRS